MSTPRTKTKSKIGSGSAAGSKQKTKPTAKKSSRRSLSKKKTLENAMIQKQTRLAHAQERAQDYVEVIAGLIAQHGEARATDIAKALGVTHVTVIRTVQRLQREGLVKTQPYRSIFLTPAGETLAEKANARHVTVVAFLEALGISPDIARMDAEGIEHHVSPETLAAFEKFLTKKSD
ncbi:MAG: manganese-binding transcriptional regulator MntR [Chthoniobacterales bacterium]